MIPHRARTSPLSEHQHAHYTRLRGDGVPAFYAYLAASCPLPAMGYHTHHGDTLLLLPHDDSRLQGFTATATAQPDPVRDISLLGEFRRHADVDTIELAATGSRPVSYFAPEYTLTQRRAELSRLGYARGPAQELARQRLLDDARLAHDLEHVVITVTASKADIALGSASMGTSLHPDTDLTEHTIALIEEYDLLDEAIEQARTALPALITQLRA